MTLLELITHLRQSILDDVGGTGVTWADITEDQDDVAQLRWSNEELTRFVNEAQNAVTRDILCFKDGSATWDLTVVADTAEYALDSRIIKVKNAYLSSNGAELSRQEIENLMAIRDWRSITGLPVAYVADMDTGTLRLYPTPQASDTVHLLVYHLPLTQFDWETAETQSSPLRLEYQIPMLNYAAYLAYQKDEANTFDPARGNTFLAMYNREFTHNSPYAETRRRRSSNRTIRYGGIY